MVKKKNKHKKKRPQNKRAGKMKRGLTKEILRVFDRNHQKALNYKQVSAAIDVRDVSTRSLEQILILHWQWMTHTITRKMTALKKFDNVAYSVNIKIEKHSSFMQIRHYYITLEKRQRWSQALKHNQFSLQW